MIKPGTKVSYEYKTGHFVPGWVVEYAAGKDAGDHRIGGFACSGQKEVEGQGQDYFNVWSVLGEGQGTFRLKAA